MILFGYLSFFGLGLLIGFLVGYATGKEDARRENAKKSSENIDAKVAPREEDK